MSAVTAPTNVVTAPAEGRPALKAAPLTPPRPAAYPRPPGYRLCTRCVMDTTDPDITFDEGGVCSHCRRYDRVLADRIILDPAERAAALGRFVDAMKARGRGRDYDCVIGVSGGVDSSYVAYLTRELGLRPLAVHLDNGWNSELAVDNIERTLAALGIDLYTHVLDWASFRDLQLAFLRASTPDGEIPTDHAINALLMQVANRRRIGYVLTGMNFRTEGGAVLKWSYGHSDWRYVRAVHRRFGGRPLRNYPHFSLPYLGYTLLARRTKVVSLLNYVDYVKAEAVGTLQRELGWRPYGGKHYESVYTRFYQGYVLPVKFNIDKRRIHLSDLIRAGEIPRGEALTWLEEPTYEADLLRQDYPFVVKKLGLTPAEFEAIMALPRKTFEAYPNRHSAITRLRPTFDALRARGFFPR